MLCYYWTVTLLKFLINQKCPPGIDMVYSDLVLYLYGKNQDVLLQLRIWFIWVDQIQICWQFLT